MLTSPSTSRACRRAAWDRVAEGQFQGHQQATGSQKGIPPNHHHAGLMVLQCWHVSSILRIAPVGHSFSRFWDLLTNPMDWRAKPVNLLVGFLWVVSFVSFWASISRWLVFLFSPTAESYGGR